ncbi:MAG: NAD(P)-dependent oxidoreductase [Syntrophobacteraceae bacterium]
MTKKHIAILGATSHIAKGLIDNFLGGGEVVLHLYTRSGGNVRDFLASIGNGAGRDCVIHEGYGDFLECSFDAVINCVGVGTANKLRGDYTLYFTVTEEYDNLAIGYCNRHPDTLYISISSGAVYGGEHSGPVVRDSARRIRVNDLAPVDYYGIVRLNAEAKHRAFTHLKIVDLRVFAYFSRFIDLRDGYFITEIIKSILNKEVLVTDSRNMVRDYIHPKDLFSLVVRCMNAGAVNEAFDAVSRMHVEKTEILDYFQSEYGLKYEVGDSFVGAGATGTKNIYSSRYNAASKIGYAPEYSSMDALKHEAKYILAG